jgi:ubiquinone/menaquinone biosynthesis C-methylase UbiE
MAKNATKITDYYGDGSREDGRTSGNRADYQMEYKYTKRLLNKFIEQADDVLEIGCGTGYYGLYLADKCKLYTGVDLTPGNIELFKRKIPAPNIQAIVGDATNLSQLEDNTYDVVMAFGPM